MRCEIFEDTNRFELEDEINAFICDKEDVRISLSTSETGLGLYYTAIVYWKENNG